MTQISAIQKIKSSNLHVTEDLYFMTCHDRLYHSTVNSLSTVLSAESKDEHAKKCEAIMRSYSEFISYLPTALLDKTDALFQCGIWVKG